jgi:DNA-binding protein HU-beta
MATKMATKMASKKAAAPKKVAAPAPIKKSRKATTPRNKNTHSYTQSEFVENVMGFCGMAKRAQARELVADMSALITECLKKGYKIPLLGLGKLYVRKTKARMGRNPATGEPIHIPSKKRIRFTASKSLKQAVLFS